MQGPNTTTLHQPQRNPRPFLWNGATMKAKVAVLEAEAEIGSLTDALGKALAEKAEDVRLIRWLTSENARKDAVIRDLTEALGRMDRGGDGRPGAARRGYGYA